MKGVILYDSFGRPLGTTANPVIVNPVGAGGVPFPVTNSEQLSHGDPDTGIEPLVIGGVAATAVPAAVANGDVVRAYFDANGRIHVMDDAVHPGEDDANNVLGVIAKPLALSTYAPPLAAANFGAATDINVKAAPGNLFAVEGTNDNAAVRYLQVHNLAGAIGAGAVPIFSFPVPPLVVATPGKIKIGTEFFTTAGAWFSAGMRFGWSTTKGTYTAATAGDHTTNWTAV